MPDNFKVMPIEGDGYVVSLKSKDEKWKNFPHCVLPKPLIDQVNAMKNMKIYEDDVILCGYPRSGTTMMQELIWHLVHDFDFEKGKGEILDRRFPVLESFEFIQNFYDEKVTKTYDDLERPRTLKTHMPVQFLPDQIWEKNPKIIHISRDVKDVALSMRHYAKDMLHIDIELETFLQDFLDDKVVFTPYREHILNFKSIKNYPNIMYVTYEWLLANMEEAIRKVAAFLNKNISEENLIKLKEHLKFDSMKKNKAVNNTLYMERMNEIEKTNRKTEGFIRKGKVGGFKEEMPEQFIIKFDKWMSEPL